MARSPPRLEPTGESSVRICSSISFKAAVYILVVIAETGKVLISEPKAPGIAGITEVVAAKVGGSRSSNPEDEHQCI